ncbi:MULTISPECIES: PilT/PilU family type 4a pilus ATPase [Thiomicrorhabdus]|uniref:PilT/PilU family type 4a pilus ATPase n=1 Tax=Thiomicrorhabdus xiamenensis TaxID=2739063 RepID=A0A7D4NZK7_9GAMM|nr:MULTISPECIES: PilT/PilU family type 4a pilus ATPase [Thiomicrorhabdus]MBO1923039.1 PilT/PilU family type 4a pilus ATPase [Thiomicrorhabdus sp. 6S3-12]QKI89818.1 PilT/PilU family type 4a pilus ATPase [Thiomicrorhabdus xiamenensis]
MSEQELTDFQKLLVHFTEQNGSDVFVTAGRPIVMKKDGGLVNLTKDIVTQDMARELCYEIMNHDQLTTFQTTSEANFAYRISGRARYRVNVFVQRGTPGMVIRSVHTEIPDFHSLNLPPVLRELVLKKRGLILIVGGTGSGKSTTLASMIGVRNHETQGHIITIEDPIEFIHRHAGCIVTQREVGVDTDSYENALKNTLRQAPDVILIGEIRARETMEHAIAFAETGHLCLSTLHANNTNQALDRIINFFPVTHKNHLLLDLSLNLRAIISQRLIPKIGGGMIAAVEVLINSPRIAELILQGSVSEIKEIMAKSTAQGMQTFDQHLFELYETGQISYEEALRNADAMNDLRLNIKLNSKRPPPMAMGDTSEEQGFTLRETSTE